MKRKRRTHSPEFKARIAMEALKGIKPVQVSQWKKELQDRMSELF